MSFVVYKDPWHGPGKYEVRSAAQATMCYCSSREEAARLAHALNSKPKRVTVEEVLARERLPKIPGPVGELAPAATRQALRRKERRLLDRLRREMLVKVGALSSEDIDAAVESLATHSRQYAADQRSAGTLFGVRFGRAWRYPAFQFDANRVVRSEVKALLAALTPDEQGWDRLQWFLTPHEVLGGQTPLALWQEAPLKVIEAANTERWADRD